ncbi:hypothetical protein SAMN05443287_102553 [Micromonospora phaseoli]|uniref:Uncharacterized protein n=1 Tax=Micromonospora phaseoli TaxID=1144548 RepID=A0A1H6V867_9ACTN|nr:hypothetical protein [Micromonospora phaseoli]PZV93694.1 hypothetical protein CLV64_109153 [Micromonospora phaseoli]GIJ79174.1 hypothetical protein Xph01_36060 [Micromonospora phaseoli]SEJ00006.1 hypothetical protein SAMN05443287_102553 [Micromonospora phaseoli]
MSMRRWFAGAGLVVLAVSTGACGETTSPDDVSASPTPTGTPVTSATTSATPTPTGSAAATPAVLSGTRQVTITRVDGFESGLSLTDDGLAEVDDDSGRQLFVPTPLDGPEYLIRSYRGAGGGPGTGEPVCWQVLNPGNGQSLVVEGAACKEGESRQQFTITAATADEGFLISNNSAYLRFSRDSGLILEELGDAAPTSSFRFNDNGPAPAGN